MRKLLSIEGIVSLTFIICLYIPLAASIIQEDLEVSASEKRKLEKFPDVAMNYESLVEFPDKLERYYDDHFGFRSNIVRWHNYVLAKVFGVSPTPMVVIGSNNWYFFDADGAISDYIGRVHYSEVQLERFQKVLQDRKEWLESLGAQYLFLPVPNKVNVYGDELPLRIRRHAGVTKYDKVVQFLKQAEDFDNFIDSQQILRDGKRTQRTFLQTDSHWNHDGTYLVYLELIRRLQPSLPDLEPLQQSADKEWFKDFSGDLAILMNLTGLITETAPKINAEMTCEQIPGRLMTELKKIPYYSDMPNHRLPAVTGCKERTYTAVVIHDSFGKFLRPYLTQHFKKVIYINYMNFENAKQLIEMEKPDVVIDQRAARNLQRALRPDPELEQLIVSNKFEKLQPPLTTMDGAALHDAIVERKQVSTDINGDAVTVGFAANKSTLSLRISLGRDLDGNAAVRLIGDSRGEMKARICYQPGSIEHPGEQQCVDRDFVPGNNELLFRILKPEPEGILSLVSAGKGTIGLKSVTVKKD